MSTNTIIPSHPPFFFLIREWPTSLVVDCWITFQECYRIICLRWLICHHQDGNCPLYSSGYRPLLTCHRCVCTSLCMINDMCLSVSLCMRRWWMHVRVCFFECMNEGSRWRRSGSMRCIKRSPWHVVTYCCEVWGSYSHATTWSVRLKMRSTIFQRRKDDDCFFI